MENYLETMLTIRSAAIRHNLSAFWNYFGAAAFQGHTMVSEAQMRVQMMASITLGARGLIYWVLGKGDPHGWAGRVDGPTAPGRHWEQAKRLNTRIVALGPTLMKLRSRAVVRVRRNSTLGEGLAGLPCTLVQETLGCSVMTYSDVENSGGNDTSLNPTCMGNYKYVTCPEMRSAAAQPTLHSTTTPAPAATGFCLDDYSSPDCRLLCDAMQKARASSPTVCGSYDWKPATGAGRCCVNPPGSVHLQQDVDAVHSVKVATGEAWECPHMSKACRPGNTDSACAGFAGSGGEPVVGHDFLLGFSTHDDGREALTLMNFDTELTAAPTLVIPTVTDGSQQLLEVDPHSGREVPAVDDLPTLPGLQISLDVAEARVFLIGSTPPPRPSPAPPPKPPAPAPPAESEFPSWAVPGLPNASALHAGFPLITEAAQQVVYNRSAHPSMGSYSHQPVIGLLRPRPSEDLVVAWKSHGDATVQGDEEGPGQRVLYAVSSSPSASQKSAATAWTEPQVLFPNM